MKNVRCTVLGLLGVVLLVACGGEQPRGRQTMGSDGEPVSMWPMTTSSDEARRQVAVGQHALDVGRFGVEVYEHFRLAVEADPDFAFGHLMAAFTAPSLEEGRAHLARAEALADRASEGEQLLIAIARKDFDNDEEGALELARQLVEMDADNPRAWLVLADVQSDLGRERDARVSMEKALDLAPNLVATHIALGNSYIFVEPVDYAKAQEEVQQAISLAPTEPFPYDLLGDLQRAQGHLEAAAEAYTESAERAPDNGLPLQQRGHVHSFLGNYEQARADYDAAISLARGNAKANYAAWRALVHLHAGNPEAAIDELEQLYQAIDGMGVPDPDGSKLFTLNYQLPIALYYGYYDVAEQAVERATALWRKAEEQIGSEPFRHAREADIAYIEGLLAARKGDYARATQKAQDFMRYMEPVRNPQKNQRAHELLGLVALLQKDYGEAAEHYERAVETETGVPQNSTDAYLNYHYGLALEGAGRTADAEEVFRRVANNYFNSAGNVLVHEAARAKISS